MPRKLASTWSGAALTLTGEFELVISGRLFTIGLNAERVLAYLALADRSVSGQRAHRILAR